MAYYLRVLFQHPPNMKFLAGVVMAIALVSSTFAQTIAIGAPAAGSNVSAGNQLIVEVDRPVSEVWLSFQSHSNTEIIQRTRSLAPKRWRSSLRWVYALPTVVHPPKMSWDTYSIMVRIIRSIRAAKRRSRLIKILRSPSHLPLILVERSSVSPTWA